jgi:hypothetical protein
VGNANGNAFIDEVDDMTSNIGCFVLDDGGVSFPAEIAQ